MKNIFKLLGAFLLLASIFGLSYAANTCQRSDQVCYVTGPSQNPTTVFRIDSGGNVTMGGNLIAVNGTFSGNLSTSGNSTTTGTSSTTGNTTLNKLVNYPSVNNAALTANAEISPTSSYMTFQATGAAVTMAAALPEISTATTVGGSTKIADGTWLVLGSTGTNTIQFFDNATVAGSQLHLGATNRLVGSDKTLTLIYNATQNFWQELSYGNNN